MQNVTDARNRGSSMLEFYEDQLASASELFDERQAPIWYLSTRRGEVHTPEGSVDDVAPTVGVPKPYTYASVRLQGGAASIKVTLNSTEAEIVLRGDDDKWRESATIWAQHHLRANRPRWWWMATNTGCLLGWLGSLLLYYPIAFALPLTGLSGLLSSAIGLIISVPAALSFVVAYARRRTAIVQAGMPRVRAFVSGAAMLIAGAILGQAASVLWDSLFPPA